VSEAPRILRLSTEMFPERARFCAFREEFARRVLSMDLVDHSDDRLRINVTFLPLGQTVAVGSCVASPTEFIRDQRHIQDGSDDMFLAFVESGPIHLSHAGEEQSYPTGSAFFCDHQRAERILVAQSGSIRNVAVRAAALKTLVANPEDLAGRPVRPGPALRLLDGYLQSLLALQAPPSPELSRIIGNHVLDLMAAALGPTADAGEMIAGRGLKTARLRAILTEITGHLSNPTLDVGYVADQLGLSRRYVHRLLEETGQSFTQHVTERRLQRAHAMLSDRRFAHTRIIDIALSVGFTDVSHFNRAFRRRFGNTPSGVRIVASGTVRLANMSAD
jgi:AraC-like DNA-binding protein